MVVDYGVEDGFLEFGWNVWVVVDDFYFVY